MTAQRPASFIRPQVKICGLTRPDEAVQCARSGADAIGLVFFPGSPRHVAADQAKTVVAALPRRVAAVGVFVNKDFDGIMAMVDRCRLSMVQLHGKETPVLVQRLRAEGVGVIKALFIDGHPGLDHAADFNVDGYLVECAKGPLPGGNAMAWDWHAAEAFSRRYPLVLAGGLSPDNVTTAIRACLPAAIDVSSGVETCPGRKDSAAVNRLLAAVEGVRDDYRGAPIRSIFDARPGAAHDRPR